MDRLTFVDINNDETWGWEGEKLRRYGIKWYKKQ